MPPRRPVLIWSLIPAVLCAATSLADDWPMWRCDAGRTAASKESLPAQLELQWTRVLPPRRPVWDDSLNRDLMPYDRTFEPVVMGGRMFVGFNDRDKLVAYATANGAELWTFFTDAPVRLPPVGWQGRVYFCSDDGYLYCVAAEDGALLWRRQGGPSARKVIGNQRVISAWPARGGPVLRDGHLYFAASIWPLMGTFLYALDAETGAIIWSNEETSAQYMKQPHSAPSFAGVAPQGALVATDDLLLVPGGRSVPAAFDRRTGELRYFRLNEGGKGNGGSFVVADDSEFYVHTRERAVRSYSLETGVKTAFMTNEPVLAGERIYAAEMSGELPVIRAYDRGKKVCWEVAADGRGDLILAGNRLYAAGKDRIVAVERPQAGQRAKIVWSHPVDGDVARLLAADGRLFAVTLDGRILAFAAGPEKDRQIVEATQILSPTTEATNRIHQLFAVGDAQGYAFWFDIDDEDLLEAAVALSPFTELAIVDEDAEFVDRWRRRCDLAGADRTVRVHRGNPSTFKAPPYVANMIFVGNQLALRAAGDTRLMARLYQSVRPYGGVLQLLARRGDAAALATQVTAMELENARVALSEQAVLVHREGPLVGAADWTHQYGDISNTVKSNDQRVKLPLGMLWFGGNSNMDVLPRHSHGPPEQVVGGRLFVQGMDRLSARDVYTGRVLWKRQISDLETLDVYYDDTYRNTPLDTAYNQVHIPGANARGTNYVVTEDRVYVVVGSGCQVLDPATGELLQEISLPQQKGGEPEKWGFIGVYKDVLFGGAGFADYRRRHQLSFETMDSMLKKNKRGFGSKSLDRSASVSLVAFDRHTGKVKWQVKARHSFLHNAIVAGNERVYCLDRNPRLIEDALRRRGESTPDTYRLLALDYQTGELAWEVPGDVFGTWLGYSEAHDALLQAGAAAGDRLATEEGRGMAVYRGETGDVVWRNEQVVYSGPCILHGDQIITNANSNRDSAGAFSLIDGSQKMIKDPLTGEPRLWTICRTYGCNSIIASEHLLTFRSGAAGYYDMQTDSGTGNLGGFKSGCTANLVVANGVLNAPDYTRTCSCAYQNQTSLALIHMPEMEMWTVSNSFRLEPSGQRIRQMGVNLGAPGDRCTGDGVLWLEHPVVGGESPPIRVDVEGEVEYYRRHATAFRGDPFSWVYASGVVGASTVRVALSVRPNEPQDDGKTTHAVPESPLAKKPYSVRLFFANPNNMAPGARVFDVSLQGQLVLERLDIAAEAERGTQTVVRQFDGVMVGEELEITFTSLSGQPVLSGVELRCTESGDP
ncbi:MAG: PQQ-binding-like beta-propeller repeat protein [Pirellulaceae bacterium]